MIPIWWVGQPLFGSHYVLSKLESFLSDMKIWYEFGDLDWDNLFVFLHDPLTLSVLFSMEESDTPYFVDFEEMNISLYVNNHQVLETIKSVDNDESSIAVNVSTGCDCKSFRNFLLGRIGTVINFDD